MKEKNDAHINFTTKTNSMVQIDLPEFVKSYLQSGWGWIILIFFVGGAYLLISGFVGKFPFGFFSLPIGRQKTKRNKVFRAGAGCLLISLIGLFFYHPKPVIENEEANNIGSSFQPFLGKWLVLPSAFNQNKTDFVMQFYEDEGVVKGKILRDEGKAYGYFSKLSPHPVSPNRATGSLGMNDGRKLSFKAEIQPDSQTLVVEYADRKTKRTLGVFESKRIGGVQEQ